MDGGWPGGGRGGDGALERFLASAIATILSIILGWRLLRQEPGVMSTREMLNASDADDEADDDASSVTSGPAYGLTVHRGNALSHQEKSYVTSSHTGGRYLVAAAAASSPESDAYESARELLSPVSSPDSEYYYSPGRVTSPESEYHTCHSQDSDDNLPHPSLPLTTLHYDPIHGMLDRPYDREEVWPGGHQGDSDESDSTLNASDVEEASTDHDSSGGSSPSGAQEYQAPDQTQDSSSESEYCALYASQLDTITEEESDQLSSSGRSKFDSKESTDAESAAEEPQDPNQASRSTMINTVRPLIIGPYTDRSSQFSRENVISSQRSLSPCRREIGVTDIDSVIHPLHRNMLPETDSDDETPVAEQLPDWMRAYPTRGITTSDETIEYNTREPPEGINIADVQRHLEESQETGADIKDPLLATIEDQSRLPESIINNKSPTDHNKKEVTSDKPVIPEQPVLNQRQVQDSHCNKVDDTSVEDEKPAAGTVSKIRQQFESGNVFKSSVTQAGNTSSDQYTFSIARPLTTGSSNNVDKQAFTKEISNNVPKVISDSAGVNRHGTAEHLDKAKTNLVHSGNWPSERSTTRVDSPVLNHSEIQASRVVQVTPIVTADSRSMPSAVNSHVTPTYISKKVFGTADQEKDSQAGIKLNLGHKGQNDDFKSLNDLEESSEVISEISTGSEGRLSRIDGNRGPGESQSNRSPQRPHPALTSPPPWRSIKASTSPTYRDSPLSSPSDSHPPRGFSFVQTTSVETEYAVRTRNRYRAPEHKLTKSSSESMIYIPLKDRGSESKRHSWGPTSQFHSNDNIYTDEDGSPMTHRDFIIGMCENHSKHSEEINKAIAEVIDSENRYCDVVLPQVIDETPVSRKISRLGHSPYHNTINKHGLRNGTTDQIKGLGSTGSKIAPDHMQQSLDPGSRDMSHMVSRPGTWDQSNNGAQSIDQSTHANFHKQNGVPAVRPTSLLPQSQDTVTSQDRPLQDVTSQKRTVTASATSTALARRTHDNHSELIEDRGEIISATGHAEATGVNPYVAVARATARAASLASANATCGVADISKHCDVTSDISVVISTSCRLSASDSASIQQDCKQMIESLGQQVQYKIHRPDSDLKAIEGPNMPVTFGDTQVLNPSDDEMEKVMTITIQLPGREPQRVECEVPTHGGNQEEVSAAVSSAVKRILSRVVSEGQEGRRQLNNAVDRVTRQVLQAYNSDLSDEDLRATQGHNTNPQDSRRMFYVTGTHPDTKGASQEKIILQVAADAGLPNVEHVVLAENENEVGTPSTGCSPTAPAAAAAAASLGMRDAGKMQVGYQQQQQIQSMEVAVSQRMPQPAASHSSSSSDTRITRHVGYRLDGAKLTNVTDTQNSLANGGDKRPIRGILKTGTKSPDTVPTTEVGLGRIKPHSESVRAVRSTVPVTNVRRHASSPASSPTKPAVPVKPTSPTRPQQARQPPVLHVERKPGDNQQARQPPVLHVERKPYDSVLLKPVQDSRTPYHITKQLEDPPKEDILNRFEKCSKVLDAKNTFYSALPGDPLPVMAKPKIDTYDAEFEKRKQKWANKPPLPANKSMVVVDIDIDNSTQAESRERPQNTEDIKRRLSAARPRAPPPNPQLESVWNESVLKAARSHDRALNVPPRSRKGSTSSSGSPFDDDSVIRKAKSLNTLPSSFFKDRNSYTSLYETDLDTLEQKQTPLVQETDLDDVLGPKAKSLSNLNSPAKWMGRHYVQEDRHHSTDMLDSGHMPRRHIPRDRLDSSESQGSGDLSPERCTSESELRIAASLKKLSIPDWYRSSIRKSRESLNILQSTRNRKGSWSERSETEPRPDSVTPTTPTHRPVVIRHRVSTFHRASPPKDAAKPAAPFELPSKKLRNSDVQLKQMEIKPIEAVPPPMSRNEPGRESARDQYLRLRSRSRSSSLTRSTASSDDDQSSHTHNGGPYVENHLEGRSGPAKSQNVNTKDMISQECQKIETYVTQTFIQLDNEDPDANMTPQHEGLGANDIQNGMETRGSIRRPVAGPPVAVNAAGHTNDIQANGKPRTSSEVYDKMLADIEHQKHEIQESVKMINSQLERPSYATDNVSQPGRGYHNVKSAKRGQQQRPPSGRGRNDPRQGQDVSVHSLEEVIDGLLGLPPPVDNDDHWQRHGNTDNDYNDDPTASPKTRAFRLLRHAADSTQRQADRGYEAEDDFPNDHSSNQTGDISEDTVTVVCRNPKCGRRTVLSEARRTYKTCHNCFSYYCSRDCRKAHWERHKRKCVFSRINSACKHVIRKVHDDTEVLTQLTKLAKSGYVSKGRGCVIMVFPSPERAMDFLRRGLSTLDVPPAYVNLQEINRERDVIGDHVDELVAFCKSYNPDIKFVFEVAIVAGEEVPSWPQPRRQGPAIKKCAKLRLSSTHVQPSRGRQDAETLILTAVPGSEYTENMDERRAREICFVNIQRKLRERGVNLRQEFPDVYTRLCSYVTDKSSFAPITIYPFDRSTGRKFMCLIMPNSEPEVGWMYEPDLMEELGLSTAV